MITSVLIAERTYEAQKMKNKLGFKLRYTIWKEWKSANLNNKFYQYLVLLNLAQSPTFNNAVTWHFVCEGLKDYDKILSELSVIPISEVEIE